jgi:hypothetical protein
MRRLLLAVAVSVPLIGISSPPAEAFGWCDGWGYAPYYIYYGCFNCYVYQPPYRPSCYRRRACERTAYRRHRGWRGWFHGR